MEHNMITIVKGLESLIIQIFIQIYNILIQIVYSVSSVNLGLSDNQTFEVCQSL